MLFLHRVLLPYCNEALVALHICSPSPSQKGSQIEISVLKSHLKITRINV